MIRYKCEDLNKKDMQDSRGTKYDVKSIAKSYIVYVRFFKRDRHHF